MERIVNSIPSEVLGFRLGHVTVTLESGEVVFDGNAKSTTLRGTQEEILNFMSALNSAGEKIDALREAVRRTRIALHSTMVPQSGKHRARWLRKRPWMCR